MKQRSKFGVNIGSSSLLLIFVVLCLVSFAALSIVSANADYRLGRKLLDRTTAYYEACNLAEAEIAKTDEQLRIVYYSVATADEYFELVGTGKHFIEPISDLQNLEITLEFLYPEEAGDGFYCVKQYQVVNNENIDLDDSLPVMK